MEEGDNPIGIVLSYDVLCMLYMGHLYAQKKLNKLQNVVQLLGGPP